MRESPFECRGDVTLRGRHLSESEPQVFLGVRSGNEAYVTKLDGETAERPETVF